MDAFGTPLSEHNYFKTPSGGGEPMETAESAPVSSSANVSDCPSVTRLDSSVDTFETCLIHLLQAYTANQRGSPVSPTSSDSTPLSLVSGGGGGTFPSFDISPESLNSLSSEQVSTLVTSNSVNYEVIQQIMAQKQGYHGIPNRVGGANNGNGGGVDDIGGSGQSSRQQTPDVASPRPVGGEGGVASGNGSFSSDSSDMQNFQQMLSKTSLLQITPEHLQLLQQQVSDLLRSRQVSLPADMTSHQQQMLIQSVLLKQLHLQQEQLREKQARAAGSSSSAASRSTPAGGEGGGATATPSTASTNSNVGSVGRAKEESSTPSLESILSSKVGGQAESRADEVEKKTKSLTSTQAPPTQAESTPPTNPSTTALPSPTPTDTPSGPTPTEPSAAPPSATPTAPPPSTQSPDITSSSSSTGRAAVGGRGGARRKRGESSKNEPKKPPLPYNIFFSEVYTTVHAANPKMTFADASRIISMMWNAMGPDVKQKYNERHEELKKEYAVALAKHKEQQPPPSSGEAVSKDEAIPEETEKAEQSQSAESAGEAEGVGEGEAMETAPQEVKDPSLCVNDGCCNKAVFEEERGAQYCSNECVVMDTRNVFLSWVRNRKVRE